MTDKKGETVSELLPIAKYEEGKMKEPIVYVLKETKRWKAMKNQKKLMRLFLSMKTGRHRLLKF